ncbi:lactose regulatory lac9 [Fusarium beomiforme]|uniref:Lactose regulatory lac9 n=1 Tax=Fusarium beomiforme TaxID=44412 RepID=A0A9P5APZ7_9HYPO|nr:lactose regulatory lac9 [Fusarium beomiforme]
MAQGNVRTLIDGAISRDSERAAGNAMSASDRRTHSCAECRRRRIRCDGKQVPCSQCLYYQVPDRCYYPQRQSRRVISTKAFEDLSIAYSTSQRVLGRLFPGLSIEYLDNFPRDELIHLIYSNSSQPVTGPSEAEQTSDTDIKEVLLGFEASRTQEVIWDESSSGGDHDQARIDDVNGITALFDTNSGRSYVGISSVPIILHVMAFRSPHLRNAIQKSNTTTNQEPADLVPLGLSQLFSQYACQPASQQIMDEATLIDLYFQSVHLILPMALILFGGYYLHFLDKPNMATSIMGAAHRMALAMGLHQPAQLNQGSSVGEQGMAGVRTRTWWCLFCLDTWAGTTLGRPASQSPEMAGLDGSSTLSCGPLDYSSVSINASASFSIIAARIQERMVDSPLMAFSEVKRFDNELLAWHGNLHPEFRGSYKPGDAICLAALLLEYRYLNARMLLYRPFLLIWFIKRCNVQNSLGHQDMTSFTPSSIDLMTDAFSNIHGNPNANENDVINGLQSEFTGRVNTQFAPQGASWPATSGGSSSGSGFAKPVEVDCQHFVM